MEEFDVRDVLWENVSALMADQKDSAGKPLNAWQLALQAKVGPASITRMKEKGSSQRLDVLERVARYFHMPLWRLLKPDGVKPDASLPGRSLEAVELAELYDACPSTEDKDKALAIARLVLTGQKPKDLTPGLESSPETHPARPAHEPASPPPSPRRELMIRS
jgi:hypothetical protein